MHIDLRLSLRALRAFVATVEHGSITAAARDLNVAASAIAAMLDQVEAEFGADLLIRTRARGVVPTPEGRDMAARFRTLLEEYSGIMDQGRALAQTLTGTLRIGYYAPVAPAFLPTLLCPMIRANPDLRLELFEHDNDSAQEAMLAGQLDTILFAGQDLRPGIETSVLLDLPPYVLAPQGHEIAQGGAVTLADVARFPLVQLDRPLARPYISRLFRQNGLAPHIAAQADSTEMVRSLVGAGAGLAILSMRPLTALSYGGDTLLTLPLEPGLPGLQLLSGRIPGRSRKPVSAFLEAIENWRGSSAAQALTCPPDQSGISAQ
ncbi:HTH-type transcriptional regulator BenM [Roseovarius litorisediminis]|uniref:HTH-type transcriptional regulator BenM n=1 Tax=Roseovarius litorisediminis TaxID=1312363 RepID=A0A1Y5RQ61_9RHOB|nr:LysR family transcriptional regulator [Roseovarius litorisediminis]SLN21710.1 HTH-type transcriptional regulator BenM [Roseovarius litorisediminis]